MHVCLPVIQMAKEYEIRVSFSDFTPLVTGTLLTLSSSALAPFGVCIRRFDASRFCRAAVTKAGSAAAAALFFSLFLFFLFGLFLNFETSYKLSPLSAFGEESAEEFCRAGHVRKVWYFQK